MEKIFLIVSIILFIILYSISSKELRKLKEVEIIKINFEDQTLGNFLPKGNVKLSIEKDEEKLDNYYLLISSRSMGWHGVQIFINDICEPGNEYAISCDLKMPNGGTIILSMQYTDYYGTERYINLIQVTSNGDWVQLGDQKFGIPSKVQDKNISIYFESNSDYEDIYIDNFVLKKITETNIQTDIPSLKNAFKKYFKIGTSVPKVTALTKNTQNLIRKHFNSLTLENELKPEGLLDYYATLKYAYENKDFNNPVISIGSAAIILDFCKERNISVRGHTLVWHSQTPTWFFKENWIANREWVNKDTMLIRMENYIKNVFKKLTEEYPTIDFYAWDVVNEVLQENGNPRIGGTVEDGIGYSPWVKVFGDNSFVKYAFEFAKKYAPKGCKLFYNEYYEFNPDKATAIIKLANEVNSKEKLIDGIGLQSHLNLQFPSAKNYEKTLVAFEETGLDLQITELEVIIIGNTEKLFIDQADYYKEIMSVLLNHSDNISSVTFWGTLDSNSWHRSNYPLLFNEDYTAKPSYYSIVELGDTTEDDDEDYDDEPKYNILINTSFEDNNLTYFQPRGFVSVSVETDGGKTGNNYLLVSRRKFAWSGVQIPLSGLCVAGREYFVSSFLKSRNKSEIILSMEYYDETGVARFQNLKNISTGEDWVELNEFKFTIPNNSTNFYIYYESNSPNDDIFVDDFVLKEIPMSNIETEIPSLKNIYKSIFKIGTSTTVYGIGLPITQKLIKKHFNSITLEKGLKPSYLLDYNATIALAQKTEDYTTPVINFNYASNILEFCQTNYIPIRGSSLISIDTPMWFFKEKWDEKGNWVNKETMLIRMEKYIQEVFKLIEQDYPKIDFYAWDVVVEALLNDGNPKSGDPNDGDEYSPYVKIFGDNSFIKNAFQYAKKYAKKECKLYYSDNNVYNPNKTNAIIKMVNEINEAEQLIDGIGLESHLDILYPTITEYEKAIKAFYDTGLDIQITELDMTIQNNSETNLKIQAIYYRNIMKILIKYSKNISLVTFWGTIDSTSWKRENYPLLFDRDYKAKPCFYSIVEIVQNNE